MNNTAPRTKEEFIYQMNELFVNEPLTETTRKKIVNHIIAWYGEPLPEFVYEVTLSNGHNEVYLMK